MATYYQKQLRNDIRTYLLDAGLLGSYESSDFTDTIPSITILPVKVKDANGNDYQSYEAPPHGWEAKGLEVVLVPESGQPLALEYKINKTLRIEERVRVFLKFWKPFSHDYLEVTKDLHCYLHGLRYHFDVLFSPYVVSQPKNNENLLTTVTFTMRNYIDRAC